MIERNIFQRQLSHTTLPPPQGARLLLCNIGLSFFLPGGSSVQYERGWAFVDNRDLHRSPETATFNMDLMLLLQ